MIEKVREKFKELGIEDRILEFDVSSATVELAALALHTEGKRIAKTMSFGLFGGVILVVTAGDTKVDNRKFKDTFGEKATMLAFEDVERLVGHAVGGVCPFAVNDGVKIYFDESLKRFPTVFPACGSSNSAAEFTVEELKKYADRFDGFVDVCKLREETV